MVAKERGIKNLEEELPVLSAHSFTYGIMNATMGVLLRKADIEEVSTIIRIRNFFGERAGLNNLESSLVP